MKDVHNAHNSIIRQLLGYSMFIDENELFVVHRQLEMGTNLLWPNVLVYILWENGLSPV